MMSRVKRRMRQTYRDLRTMVQWRIWGYEGIHQHAYIIRPKGISKDVRMGAYCHLSHDCVVGPNVKMGNYVMCGPEVMIALGEHRFDIPGRPVIFSGTVDRVETTIEDDVWIGAKAMVRSGVRVGRGAVIAMGAVVVSDVEPYSVVAGVPARKVRDRFESDADRETHDFMLSQPPQRGEYCD